MVTLKKTDEGAVKDSPTRDRRFKRVVRLAVAPFAVEALDRKDRVSRPCRRRRGRHRRGRGVGSQRCRHDDSHDGGKQAAAAARREWGVVHFTRPS
jgi:hypothetical protein